jgi:hypothetical protein
MDVGGLRVMSHSVISIEDSGCKMLEYLICQ